MKNNLLNSFCSMSMLTFMVVPLTVSAAGSDVVSSVDEITSQSMAEIVEYWTPERLQSAEPMPLPEIDAVSGTPSALTPAEQKVGVPGSAPGSFPDAQYLPNAAGDPDAGAGGVGTSPTHTGDWSADYPGPFSRWTWYGRYLTYPTSTIGKIFFTLNGGNYVCSGAVVTTPGTEKDVIATAGHCISEGGSGGTWATNVMFCPSYNLNGINPAAGCWTAASLLTFGGYINDGNSEYDVGCIIAHDTGTILADHVGNVAGELGRAWNFAPTQPIHSFGYPAASPFPGYHIITAVGPEWYTYSWGLADDSKYMGNDLTGGASGGPWIMGLEHQSAGYPDTDGSSATDPAYQWLNGVNSHKIVVGGVTRTQEMGSVQFNDAAANPNTEALWEACGQSADGS